MTSIIIFFKSIRLNICLEWSSKVVFCVDRISKMAKMCSRHDIAEILLMLVLNMNQSITKMATTARNQFKIKDMDVNEIFFIQSCCFYMKYTRWP